MKYIQYPLGTRHCRVPTSAAWEIFFGLAKVSTMLPTQILSQTADSRELSQQRDAVVDKNWAAIESVSP